MAIITGGPFLGFEGTIDGITYYTDQWGRTIAKKKNKARTVPATEDQQTVMDDTVRIAQFMLPLREFVRVGYALEAIANRQNAYNAMVPGLRRDALTGTGDDRQIDFSKVLMTKGKMASSITASVEKFQTGLKFNWDNRELDFDTHWSDQVILVAYFPALGEVRYVSAGAERHTGEAYLELNGTKKDSIAHVYISFVSSNRTSISNSTYLGHLNF